MVDLKHTPGPWKWDGHALRSVVTEPQVSAVHTILEAENIGWGYLCSNHKQTCAESDANQTLIASSPDLLDAAMAAEAVLAKGLWIEGSSDPESIALWKLRAAIEKATEVRNG